MERALPPLAEALTDDDLAVIEDVLDAAAAWRRGEIPWQVAAGVGTLKNWRGYPSEPYSRYVAYRLTARTDPRWQALGALLDVIVRAEGFVITTQGVYSVPEIRANEAGWQFADLKARAA